MARTSTYLNFMGKTEEAFEFYRSVFKTELLGNGVARMRDVPAGPGMPALSEKEKNYVMHVEMAITGGHVIMGTDALGSMGHNLTMGNNVSINLEPDTRAESEGLFAALSSGGVVKMPLTDMFWGAYWGSLTDKYGIQWMVNCMEKKS